MKVLITAAGLGTRSGLNGHVRKETLPVYDCRDGVLVLRPLMEVIIDRYRKAGFSQFVVVLAKGDIRTRSYVEEYLPEIQIVTQDSPRGFGDAVLCASSEIDGPFILNTGDGMLLSGNDFGTFVESAKSGTHEIQLGLMEVSDPSRYGVATIHENNGEIMVDEVVEKPAHPKSNLALVSVYKLNESVFEEISRYRERKNVELTPAINAMISSGQQASAVKIDRKNWVSVGKVEEYRNVLMSTYASSSPCR